MTYCKELENILTEKKILEINSLELSHEISVVCSLLDKRFATFTRFKIVTKMNFDPNLIISLRILLTLPVSVERSFSKLKIIKNFLKITTSLLRLSVLPILAVEYGLENSSGVSKLIGEFSKLKYGLNYTQALFFKKYFK